jgi:hypothetical protein
LPVFQAGAAEIVLAPRRREAAKLKVTFIQHPVTIRSGDERRARAVGHNKVHHHRGRVPFTNRNTGIQMAEARPQ